MIRTNFKTGMDNGVIWTNSKRNFFSGSGNFSKFDLFQLWNKISKQKFSYVDFKKSINCAVSDFLEVSMLTGFCFYLFSCSGTPYVEQAGL